MRAASRQLPAPDLWPDCHYVSVCAALAGGVTQDGDRSWDGVRGWSGDKGCRAQPLEMP